jgi:thiamine-monophosphate kinase
MTSTADLTFFHRLPVWGPGQALWTTSCLTITLPYRRNASQLYGRTGLNQEAQLIERIAKAVPSVRGARSGGKARTGLRLGIGDDAAVLAAPKRGEWILSCDALVDGIHFRAESYPPDSVGYKALARATSDLAAMGAVARFFLLTLALPTGFRGEWLDRFLRGMRRAAQELGMRLAGGDTTRSDKVSISITVIGEIGRELAVTRSGARPGDLIYVSGRLGRAALGLALMEARPLSARLLASLVKPHLYPRIRIELGSWLARHCVASAMMDISDGLSTDLARLCGASGVGAQLGAERIPCVRIPAAARRVLRGKPLDPLRMALHGGEDYELLFTVPRRKLKRLRSSPEFGNCTAIGEITRGGRITLVDPGGRATRLEPLGWDPFS